MRGALAFLSYSPLRGFPRSCLLRAARRGAACGSAIQGLGKGGALSLVLTAKATTEEMHRVFSNRDINPGCVGAMHCYKAPLWSRRWDLRLYEPNTAIFAPTPPTAVTRRREEEAVGQDAKQRPSSQFAERAGSGLKDVRAQVRVQTLSLVLYFEGFLNPVSLTQRNEAQRIEVQCRVPVSGQSASHLHSPLSSTCRTPPRRATRSLALKPPYRCRTLED
jgi:hypothetical protein